MRRKGRIVLGLGLLAVGGWAVVPGMIHPISSDAVVNAELVTLRTPVSGIVASAKAGIGDRVTAGEMLARVRALRPGTERRDQLQLDLAAQRRLIDALAEEEATLADMERDLGRRAEDYRKAAQRGLGLARSEASARLKAAEANHAVAEAELARRRHLLDKDLLAPVALSGAEAEVKSAAAVVEAARADLARVGAEHEAVSRGVLINGGADDASYSVQRRDEVRLKRAARRVEVAQAEVRAAELERQLDAEERSAAGLADARIEAPVDGVVWQRFAVEGGGIQTGDPMLGIVDCRSLFLTATLPKRYFSGLRAGDRARARLFGGGESVAAVVRSVRAAGSDAASAGLAVSPSAEAGRDVVVTLDVAVSSLDGRSDNLCQVGQRATVTFHVSGFKPIVGGIAGSVRDLVGGRAS